MALTGYRAVETEVSNVIIAEQLPRTTVDDRKDDA
jgi:hypothetical protein